jgi:tRNA-uridine 2-sulfurtransferase
MTGSGPSTVLVAMSGGVDSSLAAGLLKEQGWQVHGLHLVLPSGGEAREQKLNAVERASGHLEIPLWVADVRAEFMEKVITPFVAGYLAGSTPNPCVVCNACVKFPSLRSWARDRGIGFTATGHYARVGRLKDGSWALFRGRDRGKEQSYFLHRLDREALSRVLFPLGGLKKTETRAAAARLGLPAASEPESQEICFLGGEDYRRFLGDRAAEASLREGDIVDSEGRRLGRHRGVFRYTIGQRRGLGVASDRPYYVTKLRPETREVVVGRREDLYKTRVDVESLTWPSGPPEGMPIRAEAQIRYRHSASPGELIPTGPGRALFVFDEPQPAVTPGQALVLYDGDRVLGGGWIRAGC